MKLDPVTASEAVARVRALADHPAGCYYLGAGKYQPDKPTPYTVSPLGLAADCRVVALHGWKLPSVIPGFNRTWTARAGMGWRTGPTVTDDLNYNSIAEAAMFDARNGLFTVPETAQPGDLLCYPTVYLMVDGARKRFVGHGAMVETVPADWSMEEGWHRLGLLQCKGPPGRYPAVVATDGAVFDMHDQSWPKPEHRTVLVRPKERA